MEKQGVIREGVTPPEDDNEDKQASTASPDCTKTKDEREAELEQDPIRRLADKITPPA